MTRIKLIRKEKCTFPIAHLFVFALHHLFVPTKNYLSHIRQNVPLVELPCVRSLLPPQPAQAILNCTLSLCNKLSQQTALPNQALPQVWDLDLHVTFILPPPSHVGGNNFSSNSDLGSYRKIRDFPVRNRQLIFPNNCFSRQQR